MQIIIIIITDLYSAFRSKDTEALKDKTDLIELTIADDNYSILLSSFQVGVLLKLH